MKSINVEVGGLISSLSAEGVRRKLLQLPGVHHADVNYVAGSATVHLDERQLSVEDLRRRIVECGYHCSGEQTPKATLNKPSKISAQTWMTQFFGLLCLSRGPFGQFAGR